MSNAPCETVRDWIPEYASGRLAPLEATSVRSHLEDCSECRAELDLAMLILASRAEVPAGLARTVRAAVRSDRAHMHRPWWGISAAAVAALALGIGMSSDGSEQVESAVPGYAFEIEDGDSWLSDDGLIAGAPDLDALSDEALLQFLDELTVGGAGGGA